MTPPEGNDGRVPRPGSGGRGGFVRIRDGDPEAGLRRDLDGIVSAALAAADPGRLIRRALEEGALSLPLDPEAGTASRAPGASGSAGGSGDAAGVVVVAVGKAAPAMAEGALGFLGRRVRRGVVLAPRGVEADATSLAPLRLRRGGHPLPDEEGVRGAEAVVRAVRSAGPDEVVLLLVSGGGSALLTLPAEGVSLADLRATTRLLLQGGADIRALNAVRKHLERLKGGGLARAAGSTPLRAALLSDVVGDPPDVIASGPVSPDPSTFADALAALDGLDRAAQVPRAVRDRLGAGATGRIPETPGPGRACFEGVEVRVVGNAATAVAAGGEEASRRGYRVRELGTERTGEAREEGGELGRRARDVRRGREEPRPPACLLGAGETTVDVTGDGRGGRNHEVALGAARPLAGLDRVLVASVGTDGVDGLTDAAGALVTGTTLARARAAGLDPDDALRRNDTGPFFRALGDRVVTGPTGTNVMDLHVVLVGG